MRRSYHGPSRVPGRRACGAQGGSLTYLLTHAVYPKHIQDTLGPPAFTRSRLLSYLGESERTIQGAARKDGIGLLSDDDDENDEAVYRFLAWKSVV